MPISYDYYRTFYYVAKYQNITAAANALFLSQPTVSRCIQHLEQELGCQLFIRTKKGVTMTHEATILYQYVTRAHRNLTQAENELREVKSISKKMLRIGATEMTLQNYLMPYLTRFHDQFPSIKLQISNNTTNDSLLMLDSNLVDIAIVHSPVPADERFRVQNLVPVNDIFIAGNQYEALRGKELHLSDLVHYPLICIKREIASRAFLEQLFQKHHLILDPNIEIARTDLIPSMVAMNMGIGIVPYRLAADEIRSGRVFPLSIAESFPPRNICLVSHIDRPMPMAAQKFIELLAENTPE